MKFFIVLASVLLPVLMVFSSKKWNKVDRIFNWVAVVSSIIFGNIAAIAIYEILKDNTVFMTNIHGIFLNPYFLITGSYLGLYLIYQLLHITMKR